MLVRDRGWSHEITQAQYATMVDVHPGRVQAGRVRERWDRHVEPGGWLIDTAQSTPERLGLHQATDSPRAIPVKAAAFVGYGVDKGTRTIEPLRAISSELGMAHVGQSVDLSLGDFDNGRLVVDEKRVDADIFNRYFADDVMWGSPHGDTP